MKSETISPSPPAPRHYSGILVYTTPTDIARCVDELERMAGVEVHHTDPATGRIIAVLESDAFAEQEQLLRRVQQTPPVLLAELVYYRRDEEPTEVHVLGGYPIERARA